MMQHDSLSAIQLRLYESVRSQAFSLTGFDSEELICYEHEFLNSMKGSLSAVSPRQVKKRLLSSDIILISDFHSLPASQKTCLDILRLLKDQGNGPVVLALECFFREDQKLLHAYLNGSIDEEELYSLSYFEERWGFPWGPVSEILDFARTNQIQLWGINQNSGPENQEKIGLRDDIYATHCAGILRQCPECTLVVLAGEYHLSSDHLPFCLKKKIPLLSGGSGLTTFFYSLDKIYFDLLLSEHHPGGYFWKSAPGEYHFLHTPPWGKWYSWLLWQDHRMFEPSCESCPPASHPPRLSCNLEPEDLLGECLFYFRQYFGQVHPVPEFTQLIKNIRVLPWSGRNVMTQECSDPVQLYQPESKTLSLAPLDWKSMIHGLGAGLISHYGTLNPARKKNLKDALKIKTILQTMEFIFNPGGSLSGLADLLLKTEKDFYQRKESQYGPGLYPGNDFFPGNLFSGNLPWYWKSLFNDEAPPRKLKADREGEDSGGCTDIKPSFFSSGRKETR